MEIIIDRPPIYDEAAKIFPLEGREIFAYGNKIYNPGGFDIPGWLVAHEMVHEEQQDGDPEGWWDHYLAEPEFRLDQELAAHIAEYQSYCKHNRDRNKQVHYRMVVARKLAAPLYGGLITKGEALRLLK